MSASPDHWTISREESENVDLTDDHGADGRVWKTALVCAIYTVLAFAFFHALWTTHPAGVMQLSQDPFNFAWLLQWTPWALLHGHNPFYSDYLNYPYGVNLLTNAGVPGLGILFAPVTLLFGPVAGFNTAETLSVALAAIAGYFFVRRWVSWRPAAFVGGLLFGFSPYELAQTGHLNLTFIAILPLIFLSVHEIIVRQKGSATHAGVTLGVLVVAQFFVSSELLFDAVIIGAIAVITTVIIGRRSIRSHFEFAARGSLWAVGVAVVLLAYPVWFAVRGPAHISGKIQLVPQGYRADFLGPIVPDSMMFFAPANLTHIADNFASSVGENGSYLGISLLLVLAIATVALWRNNTVKVAAVAGVSAFIFSLGSGLTVKVKPPASISGLPLPGRILAELPLVNNGIPSRFALFSALCAALVLAICLESLYAWSRDRFRDMKWLWIAVPGAVAVFALILLIPAPLSGVGPLGTPAYFTTSAYQRIPSGTTAVVYPFNSPFTPGATIWQAITTMHFRQPGGSLLVPGSPNGAIAFSPRLSYARATLVATVLIGIEQGQMPARIPTLRAALRQQLRTWEVQSVVVFPALTPNPPQCVAFFEWLLGRSPDERAGGAYAWYGLPA